MQLRKTLPLLLTACVGVAVWRFEGQKKNPDVVLATFEPYKLQNVQVLTNNPGTNQTYTPTTGTRAIWVECIGGGGAGGGNNNSGAANNSWAGSGGGGGALTGNFLSNPTGIPSENYSVGLGGNAGNANNNTAPTAGGNTLFGGNTGNGTFGNICNAGGGAAGIQPTEATTILVQAGGAGGVPNTGKLMIPGGVGGSSLRSGTNGNNPISGAGGSAAGLAGGQGGQAVGLNSNGGNGSNYGGGGSGAAVNGANNKNGGNGAQGVIVIYEFT